MKRVLAGLIALVAAVAVAPSGASADGHIQVTLLHGIPGATVDVAVGGEVLIPGFEPGATQDLTPFAGQTLMDVEVRAAGTEDVVVSAPELAVPDDGMYLVVAHLAEDGTPTITPFQLDDTPTADGQGRLTAIHAAAAAAVDVSSGEDRVVENLSNGNLAALELPAGPISGLKVGATGQAPLLDIPPADLAAGTNLAVLAVGSFDEATITFYSQAFEVGVEGAEGDEGDESDGDDSESGDGTPAPTEVGTGNAVEDGANIGLLAAAAGLFVLAGGAFAIRRRTAGD